TGGTALARGCVVARVARRSAVQGVLPPICFVISIINKIAKLALLVKTLLAGKKLAGASGMCDLDGHPPARKPSVGAQPEQGQSSRSRKRKRWHDRRLQGQSVSLLGAGSVSDGMPGLLGAGSVSDGMSVAYASGSGRRSLAP